MQVQNITLTQNNYSSQRHNPNFTAITGSDPRFGVTVSMEKTKGQKKPDTHSPVEDMIM